ncbi:MAG: hypothetical protein VKJ64_02285 [Leptolyngbyaceae bacterium]|nr:hypothetical protein [Leptolyngbyaceae bacterium]
MIQQANTIDCKTACVNGCVLGEQCPNKEYRAAASEFMKKTSLEEMHEIAEIARRKKLEAPPKWVFPEGGVQPE